MGVLKVLALFLRVGFVTRVHLTVEILALRQQMAVMKRSHKRPKLRPGDRVFWSWPLDDGSVPYTLADRQVLVAAAHSSPENATTVTAFATAVCSAPLSLDS